MKNIIQFEKGYADVDSDPYVFIELDLNTLTYTVQTVHSPLQDKEMESLLTLTN